MINIIIQPAPELAEWKNVVSVNEKHIRIALVRALNKTARWMRTRITKDAARSLNIKQTPIRKGLMLLRARASHPVSGVALGKRAGVIKAKDLGTYRQNLRGTRAGKRQFDHAFITTMPSGHRGVFRRRGKARLPIQEVQIVATGRIAKVMEALEEGDAIHRFHTLFDHEMRYIESVSK